MSEGTNIAEWLAAIDRDDETTDSDLLVAVAIVITDATSANDIDLAPQRVAESTERLERLGYLRPVLLTDHPLGDELIYELAIPTTSAEIDRELSA